MSDAAPETNPALAQERRRQRVLLDRIQRLQRQELRAAFDDTLRQLRADADARVARGEISRAAADRAVRAARQAGLAALAGRPPPPEPEPEPEPPRRSRRESNAAAAMLEYARVVSRLFQRSQELDRVVEGIQEQLERANGLVFAPDGRPKCIIGDFPNVRPRGCTTKHGVVMRRRARPPAS